MGLTGKILNMVSIQINYNGAAGMNQDDGQKGVEDTPTGIKTLEEVVAVSPMREHPQTTSDPFPDGKVSEFAWRDGSLVPGREVGKM